MSPKTGEHGAAVTTVFFQPSVQSLVTLAKNEQFTAGCAARSLAPSVPLRVGNVIVPPGSDLAQELEAFEAAEAQVAAASWARFFKEQEEAHLAAAETKRCLEAEQQCKEQQAIKEHWQESMMEKEWDEKDARQQQRALGEQMLKNGQVEYELLQGEVKTLADSAAASAASAAQAKAYKALVVPRYPDPAA
ncbi:hypothetical protein BT96DRAFT_999577 [Gymnopus androsaceus JB14]|uniref:Uncharacterized protein n=1 Tax=Gymnopus androsaceus JB14 TaxID=1447944 RepID=A0A6A4H567_9AGAR|nr:hypothetical protein BT96DRAFT_999577 [Gymnopus androsaceus JB14]